MSEILDRVFPEPEGEWVGARLFVESPQRFKDFESLINNYNMSELTAGRIASQQVCEWPDDIRYKLRGY